MNYNDIQLLIKYKKTTKLLKIAQELKEAIENMIILNNDEINILKMLKEIINIQEIKTKQLKKTIDKSKLLKNITIEDLINIEIYDK